MTDMMEMRPFLHPQLGEISLQGVLHALSDPERLALFRRICSSETSPVSCVRCAPSDMPKSSLSRHVQILREAGLVRSERRGSEVVNLSRANEVDTRFPGLLDPILAAYASEHPS
ncbi:MAG: ArsR/SmtB family transcription factor [Janthinobacterium lividum]